MSTELVETGRNYLVPRQAGDFEDAGGTPDEKRYIRFGWIVIGLFFGVFLGFAAFARLDAAAYAMGTVSVAGNRQAVQHRDGGIVSALRVKEGDHVKAGQVLIDLAGAEVAANERALAAQVISLQAARARLLAERTGAGSIAPVPEFAQLSGEDRVLADSALRLETTALMTNRASLQAQKQVLGQQQAQVRSRIAGLSQQLAENDKQGTLFDDQLEGMQTLVDKGYASINRVRELQRARASVLSDRANLRSTAAAAQQQVGEVRMQALTLDAQHLDQVSDELRRNEEALGDALPKWQDTKRRLQQTQIRSPTDGQIVGLKVFNAGAVIAAGDKLMEVVPDARPLVVQADFNPTDLDDIRVGQTAEIRFVALHERDLPVFTGTITRLSADSFLDERSGARYYTGEVTVSPADLAEISKIKGDGNGVKAGMPVQVLVPLRKRTLLQYLLEPLTEAIWRGGREH